MGLDGDLGRDGCSARGIDGGWCDLRERRGPRARTAGHWAGAATVASRAALLLVDSLRCCPPTRWGRSSQPLTGEGPRLDAGGSTLEVVRWDERLGSSDG